MRGAEIVFSTNQIKGERGRESQGLKGDEEEEEEGTGQGEVGWRRWEIETETEPGIGILSAAHFFFLFVIKQSGPAETLAVPGRRGETPAWPPGVSLTGGGLSHASCDDS